MLIVDEAHYIKNPDAQRSKSVARLCGISDRILFMTGTALENRVEEMIPLVELLQPDVAEQIKDYSFMSGAEKFGELVAPVYFRRKRDDVLKELPELIEVQEWCKLSREERQIYEASVLERDYAMTRRVSWNVDDINKSAKANRLLEIINEAAEEERKIIVFTFFLDTAKKYAICLGTGAWSRLTALFLRRKGSR